MTEEIINCDFYNEKICTLFSKYFGFNVECENLSLCTVDDDTEKECPYKQLKRLEQELKWANDEEKYLKECCIKAGKELEKNSFAWDGKEKNLVVQALELNKRYEILEQENKDLKKQIESDKGLITVGGKQQYQYLQRIDELEQENEKLIYKIQKVVQANDRIVAEYAEIMKPKCETSMISELMKENETLTKENENRNNWITSLNKKCEELIKEKLNYRSALEEIREMTKKYDAEVGDTIIANPIQDCYDIYCKINEVLDKG